MTDRPNQLDDLWTDWENNTPEQKRDAIKAAMIRMSKAPFSDTDGENFMQKVNGLSKTLHSDSKDKMLMTPSREWLEKNNPNYTRARRSRIRQEKFGEPFPPDLDPWAPKNP